jgi:hypothetical protein
LEKHRRVNRDQARDLQAECGFEDHRPWVPALVLRDGALLRHGDVLPLRRW